MKQIIKLTESELHRIVKESVKGVFEADIHDYPYRDIGSGQYQFNVDFDRNYNDIQAIMKKLLDARNSVNQSTTFGAYEGVDPQKYSDLLVKQIDKALNTCWKYVEAR